MKFKIVGISLMLASLMMGVSQTAAGREPPVAKLVQVTGEVNYSRNGSDWRPVTRTKYLFSGYYIKTGKDGGGKLVNQATGMAQDLGASSEIIVRDEEIELVSGSLSKPKQESGSIFQGLSNKFAKAQRYTTVRRGANPGTEDSSCDNKVRTIREITLSPSYPELVWRNACPEYSYRLVIDGEMAYEVAAEANSEMIRFEVSGVKPGEHSYRVEVLDKDGTIYIPKKESTFTWIDGKEEAALLSKINAFGDDVFLATSALEDEEMHVAAMDKYRKYFEENPDDNDMRPLLIQSYNTLKLEDLQTNEARLYNASLEDDF